MDLGNLLRTYQDEFNKMRALVEVGKKLRLVVKFIPEKEREELLRRYNEEDIEWLKIWLKEKSGDTTTNKSYS